MVWSKLKYTILICVVKMVVLSVIKFSEYYDLAPFPQPYDAVHCADVAYKLHNIVYVENLGTTCHLQK